MLICYCHNCLLLEPLRLIAGKEEYEYNLDALTMIEATDSFISQDEDVRGCQLEPLFNCTTRKYLKALLDGCGCLPLSINKVVFECNYVYLNVFAIQALLIK